jgi:hypothetical protein
VKLLTRRNQPLAFSSASTRNDQSADCRRRAEGFGRFVRVI